ncbi:MAG: UPF0149 family protein, partial [Alphaproteobacteria bacterium]
TGPAVDYTFGFEATEVIADITVSLFDGDPEPIVAAIEDPATDEFACWGLFRALTQLALDGHIARTAVVAVIERFGRERPAPDTSIAWEGWRGAILSLELKELADRLFASLSDGRAPDREPDVRDWRERTERLRQGSLAPDDFDRETPQPIDDIVAALAETRDEDSLDEVSGGEYEAAQDDEEAAGREGDSAAAIALSEQEFGWLEAFLAARPPDRPRPSLGWVDGFYSALVIGPVPLDPEDAVACIIGEANAGASPGATATLAFAAQLLARHFEAIELRLSAGLPLRFILELGDERPYESWALGFMSAVESLRERWQPIFDERLSHARSFLKPIMRAATGDTSLYRGSPPAEIDDIAADFEAAISLLYEYWHGAHDIQQPIVPVRTGPKTGRNQPCPCGSGKKYKKCCGKEV